MRLHRRPAELLGADRGGGAGRAPARGRRADDLRGHARGRLARRPRGGAHRLPHRGTARTRCSSGARVQVTCRSRYTEDALARAVGAGVTQYVILGAGLDSFAYRGGPAGRVRVFEVDHPASQRVKRAALAAAGIDVPDSVRYVPADLAVDPLEPVPGRRRVRRRGAGGDQLARRHDVPERRGGRADAGRGRRARPGHRADRRLPAAAGGDGTRRERCTARSSRRRPPSGASRGAPASRRTRWRTSRAGPGSARCAPSASGTRSRRSCGSGRTRCGLPRSRCCCTVRSTPAERAPARPAGRFRHSLGSVRGSPKRASSPWSPNRVSALTWSPRSVRTMRLPARHSGAHGSGR